MSLGFVAKSEVYAFFHAFWLTPSREMPPKYCQLHAPCIKPLGNAYEALVDRPNDGNDLAFDGSDKETDGINARTAVNISQCILVQPV
jgi:hypothetical protein